MTTRSAACVVRAWTRLYTLGLSVEVRERRREEVAADLHDQLAHDRASGAPEARIAGAVLSRAVRGMAADTTWRARRAGSTAAIVVAVLLLLAIPAAGALLGGAFAWGLLDFVAAGALLLAVALTGRAVHRRTRDRGARAAGALAIGAGFAAVFGTLAVGPLGGPVTSAELVLVVGLTTLSLGSAVVYRRRSTTVPGPGAG